MRPPASDGRVVVNKDVWAISYRPPLKEGVEKEKEFTILVTRRVQVFVIRSCELPIIKERITMAFRCRVRFQSKR